MLLVRHLQHAHGAGHADRAAAHHAVVELHGFAVGAEKEFFVRSGGGSLAAVVGLHGFAGAVQQEGAAADAARLRLHQGQHHLHGNGCVDGRTPGLEDLVARIRGQRVGGGHGKFLGGPAGLFGVAGRAFGLGGHGVGEL